MNIKAMIPLLPPVITLLDQPRWTMGNRGLLVPIPLDSETRFQDGGRARL